MQPDTVILPLGYNVLVEPLPDDDRGRLYLADDGRVARGRVVAVPEHLTLALDELAAKVEKPNPLKAGAVVFYRPQKKPLRVGETKRLVLVPVKRLLGYEGAREVNQ